MTFFDMNIESLRQVDIYLIDQLLRGQIKSGDRVLDAGCGVGRNISALLSFGCNVYGFDECPRAVMECQSRFDSEIRDHFKVGLLERPPFQGDLFDVVICNAVLHFAHDRDHFMEMTQACWDHLEPGGLFFSRLSTKIAWPDEAPPCFAYLASECDLLDCEKRWGATRVDPLKTTLVERKRTMTTWVLRKL